jgi:hypothetical protein
LRQNGNFPEIPKSISDDRKSSTRILICAQSNIAVDEIVSRLNSQGYFGADGIRRRDPAVVRLGTVSSQKAVPQSQHASFTSPSKQDESQKYDSSLIVEKSSIDKLVENRRVAAAASNEKCPSIMELRKEILGYKIVFTSMIISKLFFFSFSYTVTY